ncbi:MAG: SurA N-terminal domain-containing protein [Proteobacteria bacterium]|nr:SurA N-terminal domain-containing protein [Pseudomonadota bacterium]
MQLVFVAVVATFILAYGQTSGDQAGTVAMVNGVPIRPTDFSRELRIEEGQAGSLDEAGRERLKDQVRARMIRSEVSLQEAEALGLQVSSREIAQSLLDTPYFSEEGKFSEKRYEAIIRQQGFTRAEYEDRVRKSLLRSKLDMLLWMGTSVAEPEVKAAYVNDATRIDLEYVRVRPSLFQDDMTFTDEEVATWLADNEARVKETYDRDFERLYDVPDKFHARLLRFEIREDGVEVNALEERMKGLLAELEAGADFDTLARRWSEDPSASEGGDLGLLTEAQLGSKVVSALTGVEVGAYSKVLADERQVRLYRFEAKEAAHVISMDDVKNDIARAIMVEDAAPAEAAAYAEKLLGSWTGDAAARTAMLDEQELTVLTTGPIPLSGDSVIGGVPAPILGAARDLAAGDTLPEVQEISGVYWVGALRSRTEADMTRYETEQENVREQVLFGKRREFREMWLDAAVADATVR